MQIIFFAFADHNFDIYTVQCGTTSTMQFWLFTNTWWSFGLASQNRKILWHHSSQWWNC